jgi:hypothetical protein
MTLAQQPLSHWTGHRSPARPLPGPFKVALEYEEECAGRREPVRSARAYSHS